MKKQELIEKLRSAGTVANNVFINVSEVITMIEQLEEESSGISADVISKITEEIVSELDRNGKDIISDFDIEADVRGGNSVEISISDVSFDSYEIESIVDGAFDKYIDKFVEDDSNQ